MQFSGSPSQSVLQRNRSHESHPIGGVRARPLSKLEIPVGIRNMASTNDTITVWKMQMICRELMLLLLLLLLLVVLDCPRDAMRDRVPPLACPSVIVRYLCAVSDSSSQLYSNSRFRSITLPSTRLLILAGCSFVAKTADHTQVTTTAGPQGDTSSVSSCSIPPQGTFVSFQLAQRITTLNTPLSFSRAFYFCTQSCYHYVLFFLLRKMQCSEITAILVRRSTFVAAAAQTR